jgi:hypothetical protein
MEERDLVREADRHIQAVNRFKRERPNEHWQMDFKGPKSWPHAIGSLSVIDDHSRYLVTLADSASLILFQSSKIFGSQMATVKLDIDLSALHSGDFVVHFAMPHKHIPPKNAFGGISAPARFRA